MMDMDIADVRRFLPVEAAGRDLTVSSLRSFLMCSRYGLLKERCGLERFERKPAATIGQLWHVGLAAQVLQDVPGVAEAAMQQYRHEALQKAEELRLPADALEQYEQDLLEATAIAGAMVRRFWQHHPLDRSVWEPWAVEEDVRQKLHGVNAGGVLDLLLLHRELDVLMLSDYKSTSTDLDEFMQELGYAFQPRLYRELLGGEYQGKKIVGYCHALMRVPDIEQKPWQSFTDFQQEVADWYDSKVDAVGRDEGLWKVTRPDIGAVKGQPKPRKPRWDHTDRRDYWASHKQMWFDVRRFEHIAGADRELERTIAQSRPWFTQLPVLDDFPRTGQLTGQCRRMYGRPCVFRDLCQLSPTNWAEYVQRHLRISKRGINAAEELT